jgi:hypothetical protein
LTLFHPPRLWTRGDSLAGRLGGPQSAVYFKFKAGPDLCKIE